MKETNAKPCPAQGREMPEVQTLHITGEIDDAIRQEWLDGCVPSGLASKLADASEAALGLSVITNLLIDDSLKKESATVLANVKYEGFSPCVEYGLQCAQLSLLRELEGTLEEVRMASRRIRTEAREVSHEN